MSPPTCNQMGTWKNAPAERSQLSDIMSRSEPFLPLQGVSRRHSKGGLRELFSKNRSTRTLTTTSEIDETSTENNTSIPSAANVDASWVPPPLFQAYPQSIKHVNLEASTLSAQSIIRLNDQRRANTPHDLNQNTTGIPSDSHAAYSGSRRVSASVANGEWTRKVFVLTTSGRLLQYSGEGAFDRKPEKILQLGKDSAAFASDAIEGRHFVLHVSQSCSDDGEPDLNSSKNILSRIGIRPANGRRSAKVLFMVFDTPDDLESWLSTIRKTIESLGGRPYSPEIFVVDPRPAPHAELSQRYQVKKDPHQFSQEVSRSEMTKTAAEERPSTHSSVYTATDLERLRDSKTSNLSVVTGTPTSVMDSPPSTPAHEKLDMTDAPHLELPDLGPSSLVDFTQHGKRQSRLSLVFADITKPDLADVKPATRFPRREAIPARAGALKDYSIPDVGLDQKQKRAQHRDEAQKHDEVVPECENTRSGDRPLSTIAPLPTSFSQRHTAPELRSNQRYSRLFTAPSEAPMQLPKRYSSLEYSRSLPQPCLAKSTSFESSSSQKNLRRPNSMQLRAEPMSYAQTPTRSPSLRPFGQDRVKSKETAPSPGDVDARLPPQQNPRDVTSPFGPPVGPPPSCPLPAVPVNAPPLRRQSLAARESVIPGSWGDEGQDFF